MIIRPDNKKYFEIYSQLSRCSTARGSRLISLFYSVTVPLKLKKRTFVLTLYLIFTSRTLYIKYIGMECLFAQLSQLISNLNHNKISWSQLYVNKKADCFVKQENLINWLSDHLALLSCKHFLVGGVTVNEFKQISTLYNVFSVILAL